MKKSPSNTLRYTMHLQRLLLACFLLRVLFLATGCTVSKAPAKLVHPMLSAQGGSPHSSPFATVRRATFNDNPNQRSSDHKTQALRMAVANAARSYVGHKRITSHGKKLPFDCSGLARASYMAIGIDLMDVQHKPKENGVSSIYRYVRRHGLLYRDHSPVVGDLVFFHNTYDRNGNGRRDDQLTHIAVVESIDRDGTITIVHRVSRGILRYRMNLRFPETTRNAETKKRFNHYLRAAEGSQPAQTTAALFAGYGTVVRDAASVDPQKVAQILKQNQDNG